MRAIVVVRLLTGMTLVEVEVPAAVELISDDFCCFVRFLLLSCCDDSEHCWVFLRSFVQSASAEERSELPVAVAGFDANGALL